VLLHLTEKFYQVKEIGAKCTKIVTSDWDHVREKKQNTFGNGGRKRHGGQNFPKGSTFFRTGREDGRSNIHGRIDAKKKNGGEFGVFLRENRGRRQPRGTVEGEKLEKKKLKRIGSE